MRLCEFGDFDVLPTSFLYSPVGKQVSYQVGEVTRESIEAYIKRKQ